MKHKESNPLWVANLVVAIPTVTGAAHAQKLHQNLCLHEKTIETAGYCKLKIVDEQSLPAIFATQNQRSTNNFNSMALLYRFLKRAVTIKNYLTGSLVGL